jgi:hypothetical protein
VRKNDFGVLFFFFAIICKIHVRHHTLTLKHCFIRSEDPDDQFNWYEYDLRDANDINQVCAVINQKEGIYTYSYNSKSSGTWYKRDRNGAIISTRSYYQVQLSPAIIGGIVAACIVFIGGIAFLLRPKKVKPQEESVYQGGVMM